MDLLSESFKLENSVDLTEQESFELWDGMGTAHLHHHDDVFNVSITTATEVDNLTGDISTYIVKETLPVYMQQADTRQIEHKLARILRKDLPPSSNLYNVGMVTKALTIGQATELFQRALLIQLKDDGLFYKIQTSQAAEFKHNYGLRLAKQDITSLANSTEYIVKYVKKTCHNAYYSAVILNSRVRFENQLARSDDANKDQIQYGEKNYLALQDKLAQHILPRNQHYLQIISPLTNAPVTVNSQALYIGIKQLELELGLIDKWVVQFTCEANYAESTLDFIKKRQPMYYDLKDLFA